MSKHPFGWSYPPGAANDPNAPWNQEEGPCLVCGEPLDNCNCPECPRCGAVGDPTCYEKHGMVRTIAQIRSMNEAIVREAQEIENQRKLSEEP